MASTSVHSPLETLLLFQTLHPWAVNAPSFDKVSSELKNNEILRDSDAYNVNRLDPEPLKVLYLRLLREEVKLEALVDDNAGHEIQGQHNPRKRKLSSPRLETESDAPQYSYLLPRLTNRLYTRYRDHAIKAIEEQERKYRLLQRDIQEINGGEWDARLQHQEVTSKRDSKGTSSIQTLLRNDEPVEENARVDEILRASKSPVRQSISTTIHEASKPSSSENVLAQQPVKEVNSGETVSKREDATALMDAPPQSQLTAHAPPPPDVTLPDAPSVSTAVAQRVPGTVQDPKPTSQLDLSQNAKLPPPAPRYASPGYPLASPKPEHRRLPPPGQTRPGIPLSQSPRISHPPMIPADSSASPIILPPPPGMLRSSGSPGGPLDALADMAGQHHRASPTLPLPRPSLHGVQQHPVQLPQPRNYAQRAYPYYDSQSSYPVAYHPYGQNPLPPYHNPNHGVVSAYHAATPSSGQGPHYSSHPQHRSPLPPYYPAYNQSPPYYPQVPVQTPYNQNPPPRFPDHRTPIVTPIGRRRPPKPSPIHTSASSTKWKDIGPPGSVISRASPTPPGPDEISPISERAPSPLLEASQTRSKAIKGKQDKKSARKDSPGKKTQSGRSQQARAASTASTAVAGSLRARNRSQSLVSHADELSLDTTSAPSRIKPEPPATPARDDDTSITETTADEGVGGSRKSTRRRRETLRGLESMTKLTRSASMKYSKRSSVLEEPSASLTSSAQPNHVLGSRNFPRTSATIMNDITAHKLASMFAKPLTEREAPGYKDLIYRPQDLKSIKSAIAAGARVVATATENNPSTSAGDGDAGSPGIVGSTPTPAKSSSSSTLWLPARDDVVPPKGIVNSAQLEKELMRMFANAVMFNPDPKRGVGPAFCTRAQNKSKAQKEAAGGDDKTGGGEEQEEGGVVHDTREMCREVERRVAEWRAAEMKGRSMEDAGEADELVGDEAEEGGVTGVGRRRRR